MIIMYPGLVLLCQAAVLGWFTLAVIGHFSRDGKTPVGMQFIIALSAVFFLFQSYVTLSSHLGIGAVIAGVILYGLVACLFRWTLASTKQRGLALAFSTSVPSALVVGGPYRWVRHPFYLSYIIYWLIAPLVTGSGWLLFVPLVMGLVYWRAATREEVLLQSKFGEAYREYQRKVGMLFPRFREQDGLVAKGNKLTVREASSLIERNQLIELRTRIYQQAGKHASSELMTDQFDQDCFLIGVWRGKTPVASARVICRDPEQEWEHDRFIRWKEEFPPRSDTVEISRFCIEKHERSWAAIRLLSNGMIRAALKTRRNHILACCTEDLRRFYSIFFVARFTGEVIYHNDLGPKPHLIFFSRFTSGLLGVGFAPLAWLSIWPPVAAHGLRLGLLGNEMPSFQKRLLIACTSVASALTPVVSSAIDLFRILRLRLRTHKGTGSIPKTTEEQV